MPGRRILAIYMSIALVACGHSTTSEESNSLALDTEIALRSITIDSGGKAPTIAPDLRVATGDSGAQYMLVRFPGPITAKQYQALQGASDRIYAYLPHYTYLVRMPIERQQSLTELDAEWMGIYHPFYKLSPAVMDAPSHGARAADEQIVMLHVYPDADLARVLDRLDKLAPASVVGAGENPRFSRVRMLLSAGEVAGHRDALARIAEVFWIDVEPRRVLLNDTTVSVGQSGVNTGGLTPVFDRGLYGEGQIVGVLDTGIDPDMCYFRDPALGLPPRNECDGGTDVDLDQRKVVAVNFLWNDECNGGISSSEWDTHDHGTHVAGTVAGDNLVNPLFHDPGDGMAPGAKLVIQDCGFRTDNCADCPGIGCPVVDLNPLFQQTYDQGARIHTNSWGDQENSSIPNVYTAGSQDADEFMWNHKDFLLVFAAGNSGPSSATVGSPATAKNVVAVGATLRGNSAGSMASFSSCGPTHDGRIKPDITMPGSSIRSANADRSVTSTNCNTRTMSGTSMAAPAAAGMAALIRQYFTDGWYPSGDAVAADSMIPSGALLRAMLVNSAVPMSGVSQPVPSNCQGWGRVLLDDGLHFTGDDRGLFVEDDNTGFATGASGEVRTFSITVTSSNEPLKVSLAWTDFPSTPAASINLINDLDLQVTGPSGSYLGNVFANGESTTGGNPDRRNTLEQVLLGNPIPGEYVISVRAFNVPSGPQPFALVATGALSSCTPPAAPTGLTATAQGDSAIRLSWNSVADASSYRIYRSVANACPGQDFEVIATVSASTTTFLDSDVLPATTYSYRVAAVGDCESAQSACANASTSGDCVAAPAFAGIASASDNASASCGITLTWSAASSQCPDSSGITYAVHRATNPDFTPGAGNLLATCVTDTSFVDGTVDFAQTYYYIVRAEDSGGVGAGPCSGGSIDNNTALADAAPTGGQIVLHETDFESGANGWIHDTNDSTCSTGDWLVGNPDGVSNGGAVTQLEDDHTDNGVNAFFTAPNQFGAGTDDVDGGRCTAQSPVIDTNGASNIEVSIWYYHGQRDAGDDPAGDFFTIELSTDGGNSFPISLVSIGDVRSNATWTEARTTVADAAQLAIRVQAADGAGPGDLVEGGIDDVRITAANTCE